MYPNKEGSVVVIPPPNKPEPVPPMRLFQEKITNPESFGECLKAAAQIGGAFEWSRTTEGHDFWAAVVDRLRQIASDGVIREYYR